MVYLTFASSFNAVHRLWNRDLSEEENRAIYAECANPAGHGHQYGLEVTVAAPVGGRRPVVIARGAVQRLVDEVLNVTHRAQEVLNRYADLVPTCSVAHFVRNFSNHMVVHQLRFSQ